MNQRNVLQIHVLHDSIIEYQNEPAKKKTNMIYYIC